MREYRCSLCGLHGHRKCLKATAIECAKYFLPYDPSLDGNEPVFGEDLGQLREMVPRLIWKCVTELEKRGFKHLPYVYEGN